MPDITYGHTEDGRPVDEAMIAQLSAEADRGFTPGQLAGKPRGRGRPPLGAHAKQVGSVRLDPDLRERAAQRADAEGITVSEVVRRALREYLRDAS